MTLDNNCKNQKNEKSAQTDFREIRNKNNEKGTQVDFQDQYLMQNKNFFIRLCWGRISLSVLISGAVLLTKIYQANRKKQKKHRIL